MISRNYDFSQIIARQGVHPYIKKLSSCNNEEIRDAANEVICCIAASGTQFPTQAGLINDERDRGFINEPSQFTFPRSIHKAECSFVIFIRSVPRQLHGIGQQAVGHVLWPSAMILSRYLVKHPHIVHRKHVLEIGAGVGLCGLVAAGLGAAEVTLRYCPYNHFLYGYTPLDFPFFGSAIAINLSSTT